ncbi:ShET2/EspL2 family type III secretion system effector toxin [Escherichia coli]
MLKGSVDEITPPLSPATMNLLMAIGQNHQLTQLIIQLQKMPELHRTEMLTAYNSGHMNVINTIFLTHYPLCLIRLNSIKKYEAPPPGKIILMNIPVCFQRYSINNRML